MLLGFTLAVSYFGLLGSVLSCACCHLSFNLVLFHFFSAFFDPTLSTNQLLEDVGVIAPNAVPNKKPIDAPVLIFLVSISPLKVKSCNASYTPPYTAPSAPLPTMLAALAFVMALPSFLTYCGCILVAAVTVFLAISVPCATILGILKKLINNNSGSLTAIPVNAPNDAVGFCIIAIRPSKTLTSSGVYPYFFCTSVISPFLLL